MTFSNTTCEHTHTHTDTHMEDICVCFYVKYSSPEYEKYLNFLLTSGKRKLPLSEVIKSTNLELFSYVLLMSN